MSLKLRIFRILFLLTLLVGIFFIKNSVTMSASYERHSKSFDYDRQDRSGVNDFNIVHNIVIDSHFVPVEQKYRAIRIKYYNGAFEEFAGINDIDYMIYKYSGDYNDYYMFLYNTLTQPQSNWNDYGFYFFNGTVSTKVQINSGYLENSIPKEKPSSSTSHLGFGLSSNGIGINFGVDFDHSELTFSNNSNVLDSTYEVKYWYNRSWWDYLWNNVPKFLQHSHNTIGACIYRVNKGYKPYFDLSFAGSMYSSHKYFDAWHTADRYFEIK